MNDSITAMNGATVETVSALRVTAVSAIASAAIVAVPTAAEQRRSGRSSAASSVDAEHERADHQQRRDDHDLTAGSRAASGPTTNTHDGSGVPRRRLSWPVSR